MDTDSSNRAGVNRLDASLVPDALERRSPKRQAVWDEMCKLEKVGLGAREFVSDQRDRFMLNIDHGAATLLSTRIHAKGFIRSDLNSLLFRDASEVLRRQLSSVLPNKAFRNNKGFEISWSNVNMSDIVSMFDVIRTMTGHS